MKTLINIFLFLFIIFSQACNKDKEQLDFDIEIIFTDLIFYPNDSISITFFIEPKGGTPPYKFNWINPQLIDSKGPFTIIIADDYVFDLTVIDANNTHINFQYEILKDTIDRLKYDYRNSLIGNYNCQVLHRWVEDSNGIYIPYENIFQDTIEVTKNNDFEMINISDFLNLNLNFRDSTFQGYHLNGKFHLDSINFFYYISPVGLVNYSYKGIKID